MISTIAGTGTGGVSGDGGNAISAEVNIPTNICLDAAGGLLVADFGNNRIRRISNIVSVESIQDSYAFKSEVYPNPSDGRFSVFIPSGQDEQMQIRITTITGTQLAKYSTHTNTRLFVDLQIPPGMYWVTVSNEHVQWTEKVVIITGR